MIYSGCVLVYGFIVLNQYCECNNISKEELIAIFSLNIGDGELLDVHSMMFDKYGCPMIGKTRAVYLSNSIVFKVPIDMNGFIHNKNELCLIAKEPELLGVARTREIVINGVNILAMEKVSMISEQLAELIVDDKLWLRLVGTKELGLDKNNRVKIFNYSRLWEILRK